MEQSEFIEKMDKIDKWLNEVRDKCHEFAMKINLDFYVFQTSCYEYNPKLLLIGANPGGDNQYRDVLENNRWDKRPVKSIYYWENTIAEKPQWEIEGKLDGSNVMRSKLDKVFSEDNNLNILKDTMMMNIFYFNLKNSDDIKKIDVKIRQYCIDKTLEFIEIINPQNILFFTTAWRNLSSYGVKNIVGIDYYIKQGILGNRTVYAMPSYGYYKAYSYENMAKMGKLLSSIIK
jgi:hypothetical protein